jgi:hypothetical protein
VALPPHQPTPLGRWLLDVHDVVNTLTPVAPVSVTAPQSIPVGQWVTLTTAAVSLPSALESSGDVYFVKNISTVTIPVSSAQGIDDATTFDLGPLDAIGVVSNHSQWYIV